MAGGAAIGELMFFVDNEGSTVGALCDKIKNIDWILSAVCRDVVQV